MRAARFLVRRLGVYRLALWVLLAADGVAIFTGLIARPAVFTVLMALSLAVVAMGVLASATVGVLGVRRARRSVTSTETEENEQ